MCNHDAMGPAHLYLSAVFLGNPVWMYFDKEEGAKEDAKPVHSAQSRVRLRCCVCSLSIQCIAEVFRPCLRTPLSLTQREGYLFPLEQGIKDLDAQREPAPETGKSPVRAPFNSSKCRVPVSVSAHVLCAIARRVCSVRYAAHHE